MPNTLPSQLLDTGHGLPKRPIMTFDGGWRVVPQWRLVDPNKPSGEWCETWSVERCVNPTSSMPVWQSYTFSLDLASDLALCFDTVTEAMAAIRDRKDDEATFAAIKNKVV